MRKVGEIFSVDNFGKKAYYKVLSVNEETGNCVAELQVGYVPTETATVEDMVETIKTNQASQKAVTAPAPKKPANTKKPTKK